jgi:hypothetical protein
MLRIGVVLLMRFIALEILLVTMRSNIAGLVWL